MSEELLRMCPLCTSSMRFFFINLNEKILMCEKEECVFPFGYEDIQFIKEDYDIDSNETISVSRVSPDDNVSEPASIASSAALLEIDKINKAFDTEDCQFVDKSPGHKVNAEDEILKSVQDLNEISREWHVENKREVIKNEKWIKTLKSLQGLSGFQLLKEQEIEQLKHEVPILGGGELKIDIESVNNVSSINIEITNKNKGNGA